MTMRMEEKVAYWFDVAVRTFTICLLYTLVCSVIVMSLFSFGTFGYQVTGAGLIVLYAVTLKKIFPLIYSFSKKYSLKVYK